MCSPIPTEFLLLGGLDFRNARLSFVTTAWRSALSPFIFACFFILLFWYQSFATDLIPPRAELKRDHPRLLLRPRPTPWAISLTALAEIPRDAEFMQMAAQLSKQKSAAAQALRWRLTGDTNAAHQAIAILRSYRFPGEVDTFHVFFNLTQFALAYDWLHGCAEFSESIKTEVRSQVLPLARRGWQFTDDHVFHNYIWMSAGGVALWALATAGDDAESDRFFESIRSRFNTGLFPAWKYLDGLPSEPMGYWALYVFTPGMLTLLAAQSAFEQDLVGVVRRSDGDWLIRHFENVIQSTLPDLRYIPWGDLQSGPNGGVTREMAGIMDALTWATQSAAGAHFSEWLAKRRGLARFQGDSALFYFLYTRQLKTRPAAPPLSFLAGNRASGHFIARSGWDDDATIVTLRSTDHFGDHHHYDQGSIILYRHGLLAMDPPVYRTVRGPQQPTDVHNTLLIGGQGQRPVRGQWFKTVQEFQRNLTAGRQLETGDMLFSHEGGTWAAAAAQFAQAYSPSVVKSCVRQMLFLRPHRIAIVDQLTAPANGTLSDVQWLLQLPQTPNLEERGFWVTNENSWLRCRPLMPGNPTLQSEPNSVNGYRARLRYAGGERLTLVHLLETGDGASPPPASDASATESTTGLKIQWDRDRFLFSTEPPFSVQAWDNSERSR